MNKNTSLAVVTAISTLACVLIITNSTQSSPATAPSPQAPDLPVVGAGPASEKVLSRSYRNDTYHSEIIISPESRTVSFWWKVYDTDTLFAVDTGIPNAEMAVTEDVWYWPTIAEWVSDTELLVGGISPRNGATLLYRWTYESSPLLPSRLPVTEVSSGTTHFAWSVPSRIGVDEIYREAGSGLGGFTLLKENPGNPGTIHVRTAVSGDIYRLDLNANPAYLNLVASSSTQGSAIFNVPELADPEFTEYWGIQHNTDGFVLVLRTADLLGVACLVDSDSDGNIDKLVYPNSGTDPNIYVTGVDAGVIRTY